MIVFVVNHRGLIARARPLTAAGAHAVNLPVSAEICVFVTRRMRIETKQLCSICTRGVLHNSHSNEVNTNRTNETNKHVRCRQMSRCNLMCPKQHGRSMSWTSARKMRCQTRNSSYHSESHRVARPWVCSWIIHIRRRALINTASSPANAVASNLHTRTKNNDPTQGYSWLFSFENKFIAQPNHCKTPQLAYPCPNQAGSGYLQPAHQQQTPE